LQARPFKAGTGVPLSAWGNVLMTCHMRDRVVVLEIAAQLGQAQVLGIFKGLALQTLQLDAYRIVVAIAFASVLRGSGMPCAIIAADELPQRAISLNQEVR
jgi:hypothetical protein